MAPAPDGFASVGEQLRAARESRGLSIGDVAYSLKLNPRQVDALESDRFDLLPGRAFARGFLKNYARFLELDPQPLLDAIEQADGVGAMELAPVSNAQGTMPSPDARLRPSVFPAALVALALLVVVGAGWYFDWFQQPEVASEPQESPLSRESQAYSAPVVAPPLQGITAPVEVLPAPTVVNPADAAAPVDAAPASVAPVTAPPAGEVTPVPAPKPGAALHVGESIAAAPLVPPVAVLVPAPAAPVPAAPVTAATPSSAPSAGAPAMPSTETRVAGQKSLVFRFSDDAWVEVKDGSGRIIMSRIGKSGTVEELQGRPPFSLVIGNAAKVTLQHEGAPVDLAPHTRVSVARLQLD
ncbi:MAG: helix-turn-helix domain-containing protein [Rhodocyclaceae bacterium]|nr:helix-turn-helix domain-containing protein [Rhodocyclaceae bacterium]